MGVTFMCDINEGRPNWLCHIFGHKHVRHGFGWSQLVPDHCIRCFANSVTKGGDDVVWCRIFGHNNRKEIVGDYDSSVMSMNACCNCHARV